MELGIDVLADATGHAHEAQYVERHEGDEEAGDPAPEGTLAPDVIQLEAERFREPVGDTGEATEHHAADDDVVEVGNQE